MHHARNATRSPRQLITDSFYLQQHLFRWLAMDPVERYRSDLNSPIARKSRHCWQTLQAALWPEDDPLAPRPGGAERARP